MTQCPSHGNWIQLNPSKAVNQIGATPQPDVVGHFSLSLLLPALANSSLAPTRSCRFHWLT